MIEKGDLIRRVRIPTRACPLGYEAVALDLTTDETCAWYTDIDGDRMNSSVENWIIVRKHDADDVIMTSDATPLRVQILNSGAELTHGQRDAEYGPPAVNMAAAGALKKAFRAHMTRDIDPAELEAIDMVLTKLGRLATGTPKLDTYVDGSTYFAIAGEIALTINPATGE